jgi:hypothetical protein
MLIIAPAIMAYSSDAVKSKVVVLAAMLPGTPADAASLTGTRHPDLLPNSAVYHDSDSLHSSKPPPLSEREGSPSAKQSTPPDTSSQRPDPSTSALVGGASGASGSLVATSSTLPDKPWPSHASRDASSGDGLRHDVDSGALTEPHLRESLMPLLRSRLLCRALLCRHQHSCSWPSRSSARTLAF